MRAMGGFFILHVAFSLCGICGAFAVDYEFVDLWPRLENAWYFHEPRGIDVDADGNVYVADSKNLCVVKFDSTGKRLAEFRVGERPSDVAVDGDGNIFVVTWGQILGLTPEGVPRAPWKPGGMAVAVGPSGRVYVSAGRKPLRVYGSRGEFIDAWDVEGVGDGLFQSPSGLAVDAAENVYVADGAKCCVQKLDADGELVEKWGRKRETASGLVVPADLADDEFLVLADVAVDASGHVYVTAAGAGKVKKFTTDGKFVATWGRRGAGKGEFGTPWGLAVSPNGHVYVTDSSKHSVVVFDSEGKLLDEWRSAGTDPGRFNRPGDIAVDGEGNTYVIDTENHRIQKFSSDGTFLDQWSRFGSKAAQRFLDPAGIAVDAAGNVYVADASRRRIYKLTPTGELIADFSGGLKVPDDVAVDAAGNIYVADIGHRTIRKYSADGELLTQWGPRAPKAGEFEAPPFGASLGLAVDRLGNVYVSDYARDHVQKYSSTGEFLFEWGGSGDADGEFSLACGVAVDTTGSVYVVDQFNNRIQKFTANGEFVCKWGTRGTDEGELNGPDGIAVDDEGNVYVADQLNNRVQKFRPSQETGEKDGTEK